MAVCSDLCDNKIDSLLSGNKIGLVLGARQVGKTTLVEHATLGRKTVALNFDLEIDKQRFLAAGSMSPEDALNSLGRPDVLILDEAQRLPEASRIIKGWYDVKLPLKIIMLGSSSLNLLSQSAESLTGRNEKLFLLPLIFKEALRSQSWFTGEYDLGTLTTKFSRPLQAFLMERMAYGSYPEVVTVSDRTRLLRNLAADYLWKDILQAGLVKTPDLIKRLLLLLAHQIGAEVSLNEIATQLHIARLTVERYIELLEQCFVIFRLPAYSTNPRKEICKSRKIFFWDTGIRNALLNQFATDDLRPDIGALWENWVIAEIAKCNLMEGMPCQLFFWRSRHQSEVDLVVQSSSGLQAFEIKWRRQRVAGRAFFDAYNIKPVLLDASNPFVADIVFPPPPP